MLMAERGRLPSRVARSDGARSGECMSAKRGTVPRDGVRRPPGGALPIRPQLGHLVKRARATRL